MDDDLEPLYTHLSGLTGLDTARVRHLVAEVLAYFDDSIEGYVARRHRDLRTLGHRNDAIYARIVEELRQRRFSAPPVSTRQVRRMIYG